MIKVAALVLALCFASPVPYANYANGSECVQDFTSRTNHWN